MIAHPDVDRKALAAYTAGVRRAVAANRVQPDTIPRRTCSCGAPTRSIAAVCRDCAKETS